MQWCRECQVETDMQAYHCDDCMVCIEDYDHHCVFFSKCIGGGNIYQFWGAIGGVMLNFMNIVILMAMAFAVVPEASNTQEPSDQI